MVDTRKDLRRQGIRMELGTGSLGTQKVIRTPTHDPGVSIAKIAESYLRECMYGGNTLVDAMGQGSGKEGKGIRGQ